MTVSDQPHDITDKPISIHRAFVYSALGPGWGEVYAGSRLRGTITATIFTLLLIWFNWLLILSLLNFLESLSRGVLSRLYTDDSILEMGMVFLSLYYVWSWGNLSSVMIAITQREKQAQSEQKDEVWGMVISYLCPGVGYVYAGKKVMGVFLFCGFLLGILYYIPLVTQVILNINQTVMGIPQSFYDMNEMFRHIISLYTHIEAIIIKAKFSFVYVFSIVFRHTAAISTIRLIQNAKKIQSTLDSEFESDRLKWKKRSMKIGIALFFIGWVCPGAGQLLQTRLNPGWFFFSAYIFSILLIGILLGLDIITPRTAGILEWVSVAVQWSAMIEAPFRLKKTYSNSVSS